MTIQSKSVSAVLSILLTLLTLLCAMPTPLSAQDQHDYTLLPGGIVEPERQSQLSFQRSGILIQMPKLGQIVQTDAILAKLDTLEAQIAMEKAQASLKLAEADLELAIHNQNKQARLHKEKVISKIALLEVEFSVRRAQSGLAQARTALADARRLLNATSLRAPYSGTITQILLNEGEFIGAGMPVLQLTDTEHLQIILNLSPKQAHDLKPGLHADLLDQNHQPVGHATIQAILPLIDPESGLQRVVLRVSSEAEVLAGHYVRLAPIWKMP